MAGEHRHPRHADMHRMFREDVDHVDWQEIWDRQARRAGLADEWWALSGARPGARILDVGCGPGLFALRYSELGGVVTATDLSPDALAFLDARRQGRWVRTVVHDAENEPIPGAFDVAFVTNVLHHAAHPERILLNVRAVARTVLVAEFDPAGPGAVGPPPEHRLDPARVVAWLQGAGFAPGEVARGQAFEHYAVVAR